MMNPAQAAPQGEAPKAEIQAKLLSLLEQAAKIAADNGIDFQGLIMQFMQGGMAGGPPVPPRGGGPSGPGMA